MKNLSKKNIMLISLIVVCLLLLALTAFVFKSELCALFSGTKETEMETTIEQTTETTSTTTVTTTTQTTTAETTTTTPTTTVPVETTTTPTTTVPVETTTAEPAPQSGAKSHYDNDSAYRILTLVNDYRRTILGDGHDLVWDPNLVSYAQIRAKELVIQFDHIRPNGTRILSQELGIHGENLGETTALTSPETMFKEWILSPSHNDNMLHTEFKRMGVSTWVEQSDLGVTGTYWAQLFGY